MRNICSKKRSFAQITVNINSQENNKPACLFGAQKYHYLSEKAGHSQTSRAIKLKRFIMPITANTINEEILLAKGMSMVPHLAPREMEVLHLLSTGRPYKQIASDLKLSIGTIRTYIRRLYGKLHVNCRTEAVVKYLTYSADN